MSDEDQQPDIDVSNPSGTEWVDSELLKSVAESALRHGGVHAATLSIAVVDDPGIADLHLRYSGIPGPTDVLTFNLSDDTQETPMFEGEIVASADTAARVARQRGHSPAAELALYVVHGVLHLLGHDDHDPEQARSMHALEDHILTACGVGPIYGGT